MCCNILHLVNWMIIYTIYTIIALNNNYYKFIILVVIKQYIIHVEFMPSQYII